MKIDVQFTYKDNIQNIEIEISEMLLDTLKRYSTINNIDLNEVLQQYILYAFSENNDAIIKRG